MSADDHANTGSRARDHLANERTYLAWVRTALGGLALGIAVERFGADGAGNAVHFYAALLLVVSVALLALATRRYFLVAQDLDAGRFRVDRRSPYVILTGTGVLALLAVVLFIV